MTRDPMYKTAVIVHALASAFGILFAFPALLQGPTAQGIAQGVPQVVIVLGALLGVAGVVSAYGAWYGQKWGIWLTILTEALNGLLALPGVLFAPSAVGARLSSRWRSDCDLRDCGDVAPAKTGRSVAVHAP